MRYEKLGMCVYGTRDLHRVIHNVEELGVCEKDTISRDRAITYSYCLIKAY